HWDYKALLQTQNPRVNSEKYLLIIAFTFLVVPLVVFAISYIKPLFFDRYLIPTTLVWAIVIAAITQRMMVPSSVESCSASSALANCPLDTCRSCLVLLVLVVSILYPLWGAKTFSPENIPGSNDEKFGYENLPMVVQLSHQFLPRLFYSARPNRYFFVLDWPSAVDEKSGLFPPQEYKHLEALKRQYPQIFGNVVSANKFLETNKRFLVLTNRDYNRACPSESQSKYWGDNIQCPRWVADRLITDAAYRIQPIGEIGSQVLLLVERVLK